ncbi:MAG: 6-phosphofructokinase [Firmicutes bacterium]|nr:6-phosphofructokinase [Bacillota bacterium]
MSKKICILASGGDAPGMNACVESVFRFASSRGWQVFGAVGGYDGLVNERIIALVRENATGVGQLTGCFLKAGRSEAFMTVAGQKKAKEVVAKFGFDVVIVLGGNGSFRGAEKLVAQSVNVIGVPSTVDNDVYFTCDSLGFSSAVEESVRLVDMLNGTMQTNDRDHVVQMMGWYEKGLTQMVGEATFADIIDTKDNRHTPKQVIDIFSRNRVNGQLSNLMLMQEKRKGSIDAVAEAYEAVNYLQDLTRLSSGSSIRLNTLGHLQRGAPPSARDRWLGHHYGKKAVELIESGQFGVAVGLVRDCVIMVPFDKTAERG